MLCYRTRTSIAILVDIITDIFRAIVDIAVYSLDPPLTRFPTLGVGRVLVIFDDKQQCSKSESCHQALHALFPPPGGEVG